jgi:hypothetical protein
MFLFLFLPNIGTGTYCLLFGTGTVKLGNSEGENNFDADKKKNIFYITGIYMAPA